MPQRDMAWNDFTRIVDSIAQIGKTVSLQGEGEPSLHPQFEEMAAYVASKGHLPYTILNGSRIAPGRLAKLFPNIGVSVDTLDADYAASIGRHNLPKVLENLTELTRAMNPKRITIMTVNMGQPLGELKSWVKKQGFGRHIIQPLSPKSDYARRYTVNSQAITKPQPSRCVFLEHHLTRFYTWQGKELPCVFMKDHQDFLNTTDLRSKLRSGEFTKSCHGCAHMMPIGQRVTPA